MWQFQFGRLMVASAIAGFISVSVLMASLSGSLTRMNVNPTHGTTTLDATFIVTIDVDAEIPVNVFKGLMRFDATRLAIEKIDYNTSIADLWAEEPWYSNGDGTLSFIGGTTKEGGFKGNGSLITVTFKSIASGEATILLEDVRILQHDGLGTDALVAAPIDAIFNVAPEILDAQTINTDVGSENDVTILKLGQTTDLNGDGIQNIIDISIFMRHLSSQNTRSDFNGDGIVTTKDLSIILNL
jgi:Dockerin type I domain